MMMVMFMMVMMMMMMMMLLMMMMIPMMMISLAPSFPPVDSSVVFVTFCQLPSLQGLSLYFAFPLLSASKYFGVFATKVEAPTNVSDDEIDMVGVRSGHLFESFSLQLDNLEGEIGSKSRPIEPVNCFLLILRDPRSRIVTIISGYR